MGNQTRVDAQRAALSGLGVIADIDPDVWRTVRALESGNTTLRIADAPLRSAATMRRVDDWMSRHRATARRCSIEPLRGLVRASCEMPIMPNDWWTLPDRAVAERLPSGAWDTVPSAVNDLISVRLRQRFDPAGILNPRILGEANRAGRMSIAT
jgi:hypothetical protein